MHTHGVANNLSISVNTSDTVRTPQDNWTKSKLPARSPKIAPGETTEVREPRGCIGRAHARAEHLSQYENDDKNNGRRQKPPNPPIGAKSWCTGEVASSLKRTDLVTALFSR